MIAISSRNSPVKRLSPCQQASRRLRKNYLKQIRNREYQRLRAIVPAVANKKKVSKVRSWTKLRNKSINYYTALNYIGNPFTWFSYFHFVFDILQITVIEEAVRYIDELHMALMSKLMAKGKDRLFVCSIYLSGPYMGMLHVFSISSQSVINIYISSDDMWMPYNFSLSEMLAMMIIDKTKLYPLKSGLPQNWHLSSLLCCHHNCLKTFFYAHHREGTW